MMMICPRSSSWFLILKCTIVEKKEAEGLEGIDLNSHFPQNFGTSIDPRTHSSVEAVTMQYKAQLQTCILVFGIGCLS